MPLRIAPALCAALLLCAPPLAAQRAPFAPVAAEGRPAALRGRVEGFGTRDYGVRAGAGKTLSVRLELTAGSADFMVYDPSGAELFATPRRAWSSELAAAGNYRVRVAMPRAAARRPGAAAEYTLTLQVHGAPRCSPAEPCTAPGPTALWRTAYCMSAHETDDLEHAGVRECIARREREDAARARSSGDARLRLWYWEEICGHAVRGGGWTGSVAECMASDRTIPRVVRDGGA